MQTISIHTSHARGDVCPECGKALCKISIHTSHARGDTASGRKIKNCLKFQSTPLMREVTKAYSELQKAEGISIHTSHARGDGTEDFSDSKESISIHTSHARGDKEYRDQAHDYLISIHTSHARGDICRWLDGGERGNISIHTSHARGDILDHHPVNAYWDFNPHLSCER